MSQFGLYAIIAWCLFFLVIAPPTAAKATAVISVVMIAVATILYLQGAGT